MIKPSEISYYYATSTNQPVGPLEDRELQALIQAGAIHADTPVLIEGTANWTTAQKLGMAATANVPASTAPSEKNTSAGGSIFKSSVLVILGTLLVLAAIGFIIFLCAIVPWWIILLMFLLSGLRTFCR